MALGPPWAPHSTVALQPVLICWASNHGNGRFLTGTDSVPAGTSSNGNARNAYWRWYTNHTPPKHTNSFCLLESIGKSICHKMLLGQPFKLTPHPYHSKLAILSWACRFLKSDNGEGAHQVAVSCISGQRDEDHVIVHCGAFHSVLYPSGAKSQTIAHFNQPYFSIKIPNDCMAQMPQLC